MAAYIWTNRRRAQLRLEPVALPKLVWTLSLVLGVFSFLAFSFYLPAFQVAFWRCDSTLDAEGTFERVADLFYWGNVAVFLALLFAYAVRPVFPMKRRQCSVKTTFYEEKWRVVLGLVRLKGLRTRSWSWRWSWSWRRRCRYMFCMRRKVCASSSGSSSSVCGALSLQRNVGCTVQASVRTCQTRKAQSFRWKPFCLDLTVADDD